MADEKHPDQGAITADDVPVSRAPFFSHAEQWQLAEKTPGLMVTVIVVDGAQLDVAAVETDKSGFHAVNPDLQDEVDDLVDVVSPKEEVSTAEIFGRYWLITAIPSATERLIHDA
jgi:hypothetical protein